MVTKIPMKKFGAEKAKTALSSSASASHVTSFSFSTSASAKSVREQNYTPSITNIGGAVLRSKTQDFERLSDQSKKTRVSTMAALPSVQTVTSHSSTAKAMATSTVASTANVTNINISLTTKKKTIESSELSTSETRRGPIYKRQEIISSVQQKSSKK